MLTPTLLWPWPAMHLLDPVTTHPPQQAPTMPLRWQHCTRVAAGSAAQSGVPTRAAFTDAQGAARQQGITLGSMPCCERGAGGLGVLPPCLAVCAPRPCVGPKRTAGANTTISPPLSEEHPPLCSSSCPACMCWQAGVAATPPRQPCSWVQGTGPRDTTRGPLRQAYCSAAVHKQGPLPCCTPTPQPTAGAGFTSYPLDQGANTPNME